MFLKSGEEVAELVGNLESPFLFRCNLWHFKTKADIVHSVIFMSL